MAPLSSGIFDSLFSYKFWWPLSKLVFTGLSTHSMIIFMLQYSRMTPLYISVYHQVNPDQSIK
jgi:hypothetical protein